MFKEDLKLWQKVEKEFVAKLMQRDVSKVEFSQWKFKEWDVKATFKKLGQDVERTFEIKNDLVSERTWNVWFEYMCNGEPSWVYASKADYIVYKLWDTFYYLDRAKLLIWLTDVEKQSVMGWDNDSSCMFLVKKDLFNKISCKL